MCKNVSPPNTTVQGNRYQIQIANLNNQARRRRRIIRNLRRDIVNLTNENTLLSTNNEKLTEQNNKLTEQNQKLTEQVEKLSRQIEKLNRKIEDLVAEKDAFICFFILIFFVILGLCIFSYFLN